MSSVSHTANEIGDPHAGDYDPRQRNKTVVTSTGSSSETSQEVDARRTTNTNQAKAENDSATGSVLYDPHAGDYDPRRK